MVEVERQDGRYPSRRKRLCDAVFARFPHETGAAVERGSRARRRRSGEGRGRGGGGGELESLTPVFGAGG